MTELKEFLIALVLVLLLLIVKQRVVARCDAHDEEVAAEGYRIKARAYSSCSDGGCSERKVTKESLGIINPFVWPYSGTATPHELLEDEPVVMKQESDHEELTN